MRSMMRSVGSNRARGPSSLDVLTGVSRPSRWRELRPSALAHVWDAARRRAGCDDRRCRLLLQDRTDGSWRAWALPTRAGAALSALEHADDALAVGLAECRFGVARLIPGLAAIGELRPSCCLHVDHKPGQATGGGARDFADVLARHSGAEGAFAVADEMDTLQATDRRGTASD